MIGLVDGYCERSVMILVGNKAQSDSHWSSPSLSSASAVTKSVARAGEGL
jgi:hypothetical protein